MAYTFDNATVPTKKQVQYFDNNGSRAIYKDGWMASTFGPMKPWDTAGSAKALPTWDSAIDTWELHKNDLAAAQPQKLAELKAEFLKVAEDNQGFPIGAALWTRLHPEDRVATAYKSWTFTASTRRMPCSWTGERSGRPTTHGGLPLPPHEGGVLADPAQAPAAGGETTVLPSVRRSA